MNYLLIVWTKQGYPHLHTGATRALALRSLRQWMNGGDDVDGLACRDCPAPHDVTLRYDNATGKWHVDLGDGTGGWFDWDGARQAFLDACAVKVQDLRVKCECVDCGREMVRAYAPLIPAVGHVCYDCLAYYTRCPIYLRDPLEVG